MTRPADLRPGERVVAVARIGWGTSVGEVEDADDDRVVLRETSGYGAGQQRTLDCSAWGFSRQERAVSTRTGRAEARRARDACPAGTPGCPYAPQPHFVPPSMGQVGFFMCAPPEDLTNHSRCRPPHDHDDPAHAS